MSTVAAIRACAPLFYAQLDRPTHRDVAECMVRFDGMALKGYHEELRTIRALPDPVDYVEAILKEHP